MTKDKVIFLKTVLSIIFIAIIAGIVVYMTDVDEYIIIAVMLQMITSALVLVKHVKDQKKYFSNLKEKRMEWL